ncbi:MAG: PqqD family protein [Clostridia bacterium]|nr:PqqD family protein [Clostridia bacterium]
MKKNVIPQDFLEKKPKRAVHIKWHIENDVVTLEIENKGFFNRIAQKFFKKPKTSYIHLDEMGSFIWKHLDGETSLVDIGKLVEEKFGEKANPLYERLSKYISILQSYGFVD